MAFIVEDGSGKSDANSFVGLTYADEYFSDRLNSTWSTLTTEQKEAALIQGTDYITLKYYGRLAGTEEFPDTQALPYPRINIPGQLLTMPETLLKATCEYAIVASQGALFVSSTASKAGYPVKLYKTKVGPIEEQTDYDTTKAWSMFESYPEADLYMRPLLKVNNYGNVVIRN